jgi:hypothetical protein
VPDTPEVIVIHGSELVAVQAQVEPVLTWTFRNATADVSETLVVDSTTLHAGAAWVTENTRPPIVSEALRGVLPVLAAAE